jgi:hypothetical protein
MKLKELPSSLWRSWQLARANATALDNLKALQIPVIVSFTSIPTRLPTLHLVVRSLLTQTYRPERILLWLHQDLASQIPPKLAQLVGERFEIRYVDKTTSYRKLVHSLAEYPEKVIVTCDDDIMYQPSWLESLWEDHLAFPQDVIAHECREIRYHNGVLAHYKEWNNQSQPGVCSRWIMPIGYGGVLYPPKALHQDVQNESLFMQLAPRADDLWFKAMSHLQGTTSRRSRRPVAKPIPIAGSQKVSLKKTNVRENGNFDQWQAICQHYNIQG